MKEKNIISLRRCEKYLRKPTFMNDQKAGKKSLAPLNLPDQQISKWPDLKNRF